MSSMSASGCFRKEYELFACVLRTRNCRLRCRSAWKKYSSEYLDIAGSTGLT